jgi:hypothetical protein
VELHLASQLSRRTSLDVAKPSAGRTVDTGIFPLDM